MAFNAALAAVTVLPRKRPLESGRTEVKKESLPPIPAKKPRKVLPDYWPEEPTEAPEGKPVCKVCYERQVVVVCRPCNHALLCVRCARGLPKMECPMCRTPCRSLRRIQEIIYS